MEKNVKFQLGDLLGIGLTLVVVGIAVSYGLEVMGTVKDDMCTYGSNNAGVCLNSTGGTAQTDVSFSAEYNASKEAITGISKIPAKLPLICTVVIAAVIIGILIRYLAVSYTQ